MPVNKTEDDDINFYGIPGIKIVSNESKNETKSNSPIGTEDKMAIKTMLRGREASYGKFHRHAEISQGIKNVLFRYAKKDSLAAYQKEALEMICHKLGRIINGDPNYIDNWTDIAGYATLVISLLEEQQ
jgi:hypothetical protein